MTNKTISVVVAGDEPFACGMAVVLFSALVHLKNGFILDARIISMGISQKTINNIEMSLRTLNKPFSLNVLKVDDSIFSQIRITNSYLPKAVYLRLLIPSLCPDLSKALYLDCDMIVRGDLSELFTMETGEYSIWAVVDTLETISQLEKEIDLKKYCLNPKAIYFNAGLMLMNLDLWREERIADKAFSLAYSNEINLVMEEQSALNIVLNGHWGQLNNNWNFMIILNSMKPQFSQRQAKIIHTPGSLKPWMISPQNAFGVVKFFYTYAQAYKQFAQQEKVSSYYYQYPKFPFYRKLKYWLMDHSLHPTNEKGRG